MIEPWLEQAFVNLEPALPPRTEKDKKDYEKAALFLLHKHSIYPALTSLANRLILEIGLLDRQFKHNGHRRNYQKRVANNMRRLLIDLISKHVEDANQYVIMSRNSNTYTKRNWLNQYGKITKEVIKCADALADYGYIELISGVYYPNFRRCSRVRATKKLIEKLQGENGNPKDLYESVDDEIDLIQLKAKKGKANLCRHLFYENTPFVDEAREKLHRYNLMLRKCSLDHDGRHNGDIRLRQTDLQRIFNVNWTSGGRYYKPFYQTMRKVDRAHLQINGNPTVEIDYTATFATLAYNLMGIDLWREREHLPVPIAEPYFFNGYSEYFQGNEDKTRNLHKLMFNTFVNVVDGNIEFNVAIEQTRKSIQNEINTARAKGEHIHPENYPYGISLKEYLFRFLGENGPHSRLDWNSVPGMKLMFVESEIATEIMEIFVRADKPLLVVHDSFLVIKDDEGLLAESMKMAWTSVVSRYSADPSKDYLCRYKQVVNQ